MLVSEDVIKRLQDLQATEEQLLMSLGGIHGEKDKLLAEMLLEGAPHEPTVYAQRDPQWASHRLGSSGYTLGGQGCLVSSVASLLTDASVCMRWTPAELNTWLTTHNGYSAGSDFIFASIDSLGIVKFDSIADYISPAPVEKIEQYISAGGYVIVKVDFNPVTMQVEQHYCRYLGQGKVMDPWHGDIADIVPRYRGKTAAEAIWRAVYYK